jgi:transposase
VQFEALLPERKSTHPLGYHRRRIPERVVFEKLVQILVFGCAYWRIADESCSESTLRRRRDEWISLGLMEKLREIVLETYDRLIGLELADMAVDGCITKAPCGGEKAPKSPVDRGKGGMHQALDGGGHKRHPTWDRNRPGQPSRLAALGCYPRHFGAARRAAGAGERASGPRLRFARYPREAGGSFSARRDLQEGQVGPA